MAKMALRYYNVDMKISIVNPCTVYILENTQLLYKYNILLFEKCAEH